MVETVLFIENIAKEKEREGNSVIQSKEETRSQWKITGRGMREREREITLY